MKADIPFYKRVAADPPMERVSVTWPGEKRDHLEWDFPDLGSSGKSLTLLHAEEKS